MIKCALNRLVDALSTFPWFRKAIQYTAYRVDGLQYGSYSLQDEVGLALTFVDLSIQGGTVIDAGASKGDWSILFLSAAPDYQRLAMIEPQKIHSETLKALADKHQNVCFEPTAIGSSPGKLVLYSDQSGSGLASLYHGDLEHVGAVMRPQEDVRVTTLNEIAKNHGIERIDFLKLDLEGHELEALKGASGLLASGSIQALPFELGGCNIDSKTYVKDFWSLLVYPHGFTLYRVLSGRRLKLLVKYTEFLEQFAWQNLLARAPGVTPKWDVLR